MSNGHQCDFCSSEKVHEVEYEEAVSMGRKRPLLKGLVKDVCENCGAESISTTQVAWNHAIFEAALRTTPEATVIGLLRALRERWELTQRQASEFFGAGAGSFGKWESGQNPSGPAARLVQCAVNVPGVMEYLAEISNFELPNSHNDSMVLMTRGSYLARRNNVDAANSSCIRARRMTIFSKVHAPMYDEPIRMQA